MKPYEMTYIIRPDLDEDQTRAVAEQITGRLQGAGAEVIATLPWNPPRRRMAYPIKDFGDGFYVTTVFRIESTALPAIENFLKLNDRVLRFLLVQATALNITQAQQRVQQQQARQQAPVAPDGAAAGAPATPIGEAASPVVEDASTTAPIQALQGEPEQPVPVSAAPVGEPSPTTTQE